MFGFSINCLNLRHQKAIPHNKLPRIPSPYADLQNTVKLFSTKQTQCNFSFRFSVINQHSGKVLSKPFPQVRYPLQFVLCGVGFSDEIRLK